MTTMDRPTVLSIAGSDSGGGAGIQADLAAFAYFKATGTTAITAVTAQNPHAVTGVYPVEPVGVAAQIDAVFARFAVAAVKTGMLFSAVLIEQVAARLAHYRPRWLVVDPVMVASSGARLLCPDAVETLCSRLLPLASLITPNLPETEVLVRRQIRSEEDGLRAAGELSARYGCWVLVKGGHGSGGRATDALVQADRAWVLSAPRQAAPTTHGTGCSLSAASAACLAWGEAPPDAVRRAKAYVLGRLRSCSAVGPDTWVMLPPESLPLQDIQVTESRP
jgi:hydroxymethylpyrimidine/phosphomethylpyrimidine kinase